jgi:CheY-like chemotaxis protein
MKRFDGVVILVVEDDPDARELMQAILEQRGGRVYAAERVSVALDLFETVAPDIVISDIAMPDEDGFALVEQLRARPAERGGLTPVIGVSAFSSKSDRARALAVGFDRYLNKPVDFDALSSAIVDLVSADPEEDKASA